MDYEKAYKSALERAKIYKNHCIEIKDNNGIIGELEYIFPELQESEDEKIRKELIFYFGDMPEDTELRNGVTNRDVLAWLEKQGEQKVPINDFKAKNWYVSEVDGKIHDMTYNPADKVEPKFKVGDWITNGDYIWKIVEVKPLDYILQSQDGNIVDDTISYVDEQFHSFTIQDAKDGDVLYSLDSNQPFIYKERKLNEQATAYCGLNIYDKFFVWNTKDCIITTDKYIPSTKEQRDTLLKAMADAGYTFNFDKKELKKIEQKPVNDTVETIVEAVSNTSILDMIEDKDAFTNPGVFENSLGRLLKLFEKLPKQDLLDGLKFYANVVKHDGEYVKSTEWSEDDERIVTALMEGFRYHQLFNPRFGEVPNAEIISWIKSLKERLS